MKSKWKKSIFFLLSCLIFFAVCLLKPRYDVFIQEDNKATCYKAMQMISIYYNDAIREELSMGKREEEIDYEDLLRSVVKKRYVFTLKDDFSSDDFCRAGGHVRILIDPVTHILNMSCDYPGHDNDFTDDDLTD